MHWASQEGPCLSLSLCLSKSLQPPPPHHACRASCCKFSILSSRRGLSSCIGLNLPLPQNWSIQMPNPNPVAFYQFDTTTCVTCTHSKNGFHEIWARRRSLSQAWLMWQGICSLRPSAELDRWLRGRVGRKQGAEEERSRRSLVCRSIWPPQPEPAFSFRAHKSSGGLLKRSFCTERGKRMPLLVLRTTSILLWEDKGKAVQLWKQEPRRRNSVFPDVPLLLERTLNDLTTPPRGCSQHCQTHLAATSPRAISSPSFLSTLFFSSLIASTCGVFPPVTAKPTVCSSPGASAFPLWAQHFGTLEDLKALWAESQFEFCWESNAAATVSGWKIWLWVDVQGD